MKKQFRSAVLIYEAEAMARAYKVESRLAVLKIADGAVIVAVYGDGGRIWRVSHYPVRSVKRACDIVREAIKLSPHINRGYGFLSWGENETK